MTYVWIERPDRKGHWKSVGRKDDYVCFAHGEGLQASTLEPEIERYELVKSAPPSWRLWLTEACTAF